MVQENRFEIRQYFLKIIKEEEDVSAGVAAIRTLMEVIRQSESETVQELEANLKEGIHIMKNCDYPVAAITSGCELFLRFITLARLDSVGSFNECKHIMLNRGHLFLKNLNEARGKIVKLSSKFIEDGSRVLTHSRSRVVFKTLCEAHKQNKKFEVFVTISAPDNSGIRMCRDLEAEGIPCTLILDSAIGYIMEQVNFIMVGAEGVVESGGIANKVGSYTMAVCAKEMKKPFYVLTESFKFSRLFPLNQQDLPAEYKISKDITNMWMAYSEQHWPISEDLDSSILRLRAQLHDMEFDRSHASNYDMNICFDPDAVRNVLAEAERYENGMHLCDVYLSGRCPIDEFCSEVINIGLKNFLGDIIKFLPTTLIEKYQLQPIEDEDGEIGSDHEEDHEEEIITAYN